MNQQQKNYIKKRITEIREHKLSTLRNDLTIKAVSLSNRERIDLIRLGKVKMRPSTELNRCNEYSLNSLTTVFDFSKYETKASFNQAKFNERAAKLRAEANRIVDQIMLGDAEEALRLVKEFEDFTF